MPRQRNRATHILDVKSRTTYATFDSPEHYGAYLKAIHPDHKPQDGEVSWYGRPYYLAIDALMSGDKKYGEQAQAIVDQMANENVFNMQRREVLPHLVGFMPNVPNAIMGHPYDMFNLQQTDNESYTTPLRIYVETLVSSGVKTEELIQRGVCILAFALAISAIRPVEMYAVSIGKPRYKTGGTICHIPTNPLNLAQAGFMLCDPAYYRRLAFAGMFDQTKQSYLRDVGWAWDNVPTQHDHEDLYRELFDMQDDDMFFAGGYLHDELMKRNPVQWVKKLIENYRQGTTLGESYESN